MKRIPIVILTLIAATAAIADQPRGPQSHELLPPEAIAELLDLSQGQIDQARTARETFRTTIQPLRQQKRAIREQIRTAVEAGDAGKAGELLLAEKAVRTQMKSAQQAFHAAFQSILTPTQKAKWDVYQEIVELRHGATRRPRT